MPSITRPPQRINDLAVLAVAFPATAAFKHESRHYLYIRPDAPQDAAEEFSTVNARSLFVANVPVTASEEEFRTLFKKGISPLALVESVSFLDEEKRGVKLGVTGEVVIQGTKVGVPIGSLRGAGGKKRKRGGGGVDEDELVKRKLKEMEVPSTWGRGVWESGSAAVVRFVDRDAMAAAWKGVLRAVKEGKEITWPSSSEGLGLQRYKTHHALTYPSPSLLQSRTNAFLTHFSTLESLRAKHLSSQRNIPDADGFITVTRGGRTGAGRIEQAQEQAARLKERREKKEARDFYRFQTREERKRREGELKRRFEEERRRVGEMRGLKKVKPEE